MSGVGGVGQAPITPVPVSKPATPDPRQFNKTNAVGGGGSTQLAAQQFASSQKGGGTSQRTGHQPLNSSGRGQLVNIIV